MAGHRVGQRRAFLHARMNVFQHLGQVLVRRLLANDLQRPQQRHAAAQQRGELAVRARHDPRPARAASSSRQRTPVGRRHLERKQIPARERRDRFALRARRERTFHAVAGEIAGDVGKFRHR